MSHFLLIYIFVGCLSIYLVLPFGSKGGGGFVGGGGGGGGGGVGEGGGGEGGIGCVMFVGWMFEGGASRWYSWGGRRELSE